MPKHCGEVTTIYGNDERVAGGVFRVGISGVVDGQPGAMDWMEQGAEG